MTSIAFYTLGCRTNQYETDKIMNEAAHIGFKLVPFHSKADIYVINSCTVTGLAGRKTRNTIRHAKRTNPNAKVIATGCYVSSKESVPIEADIVVTNNDKDGISKILKELSSITETKSSQLASEIRANLMIENGCENFCSYCIVPYVRGSISSRNKNEVLADARSLIKRGAKEIILTGINLGEYDDLIGIIKKLVKLNGLIRLRLSSIEPMYVTSELIDLIKNEPKICKHLHIPLQSGDDSVLKLMKRTYSVSDYLKIIMNAKKEIKDLAITTDIIVGHPGETIESFKNTLNTAKKAGFSKIHIFSYSDRPGTASSKMKDKIDPKITKKRCEELNKLENELAVQFNDKYIGKTIEVLIEQNNKKTGLLEGLTSNYIRTILQNGKDSSKIGTVVKCRIIRSCKGYLTSNLTL